MSQKDVDPRRLDVRRFAQEGAQALGTLSAGELPRLCADAPLVADEPARWRLTGEWRHPASAAPQPWLIVRADAPVVLTCQRCLQPVVVTLSVDRPLRFVADEADAERLDEESDDDVLALPPRGLDALALVEDELILALPLVPRHGACPQPLPGAPGGGPDDSRAVEPPENAFAVLAALKRRPTQGR